LYCLAVTIDELMELRLKDIVEGVEESAIVIKADDTIILVARGQAREQVEVLAAELERLSKQVPS
jgi:hypothetical protein